MDFPAIVQAAQQYAQSRKSKCILTNVEFIALKMQSHPGQSGRFYRAALNMYKDPVYFGKYPKKVGDDNAAYFLKPTAYSSGYKYPGRLWVDSALKTFKYEPWARTAFKPSKSCWNLTRSGWNKANAARAKLGLEPIPFPG
jgi:hypothetical protein